MRTLRVLIVDPDRGERRYISGVLSGEGYAVHHAEGVAEAEKVLRRYRGRLVLLCELTVDSGDGLRFLQESLERFPYLPFSFLAVSPSMESVLGALRQGAYDFMRKPVPPEVLRKSVERSARKLERAFEIDRQGKEVRKLLSRSNADLKEAKVLSSFKGFMISMAAHDFRSIMTVLDGYVQAMREKCNKCQVTQSGGILYQASRTITRLHSMADTLLDYEAAETGRIRLEIKPFPLGEALLECIAFYKPYAEKKRISLTLDWDGSAIMVRGDRGKVMEVLDNLLYNALKFTPSRGEIRLAGRQEDGCATVVVSDSGSGIPKEKLRRLFSQKATVATIDAHARLGLGMTICKRLLEAQNGKIRVTSELGKGTKVYFSLPAQ